MARMGSVKLSPMGRDRRGFMWSNWSAASKYVESSSLVN